MDSALPYFTTPDPPHGEDRGDQYVATSNPSLRRGREDVAMQSSEQLASTFNQRTPQSPSGLAIMARIPLPYTLAMPMPGGYSVEAPTFTSYNITSFLRNYNCMYKRYYTLDSRTCELLEEYYIDDISSEIRLLIA